MRLQNQEAMRAQIIKKKRMGKRMEINLIYGGEITLEELYILNCIGIEFVVEDGRIVEATEGKEGE